MMFNCDEVGARLSDHIDEDLGAWERFKIRMHLAMCQRCSAVERSLRRTVMLLRGLPEQPAAGPPSEDEP